MIQWFIPFSAMTVYMALSGFEYRLQKSSIIEFKCLNTADVHLGKLTKFYLLRYQNPLIMADEQATRCSWVVKRAIKVDTLQNVFLNVSLHTSSKSSRNYPFSKSSQKYEGEILR
jgi:hypothetical protein